MEQVLMVVQVLITLALIIMVLIQRSDSDGFGLSGGSGGNLMSGRSVANLMTRTTAILAGLFMANALLLGVLAGHGRSGSIVDTIEQQQTEGKTAVPSVPVAGETKSEKKSDKANKKAADEKAAPSVPTVGDSEAKPEEAVKAVKKHISKKPVDVTAPTPAEATNE